MDKEKWTIVQVDAGVTKAMNRVRSLKSTPKNEE